MFTDEEFEYFRKLKLSDVIASVTTIEKGKDIQEDVFAWFDGDPCAQPAQLKGPELSECPFLQGYDYFQVRVVGPSRLAFFPAGGRKCRSSTRVSAGPS